MAVTHYVYDGQNVYKELDGNGATQAVYAYEPNAYGSLISQHRGSSTSYYHQDALGSTRELTDASEARTDTYVYSAWGESLQQTGYTINPFRWIGNVGYYYDEETADYYVRARYYQPTIGGWTQKDPLGFIDGMNLYLAYFVPSAVDPAGLWKKISDTIYEAEGEEDTMMSLSFMITGQTLGMQATNDDWPCIWPVVDDNLWEYYPQAKACARADVSNLITAEGEVLKIHAPGNDPYMKAIRGLFGGTAQRWSTGKEAGRLVRDKSRQGKAPIQWLAVGGHCWGDNAIVGEKMSAPFTLADIFFAAEVKGVGNTYTTAKKKVGPPKCWFTRNARMYGFGCHTAEVWAVEWAASIKRGGARVYGTPECLVGNVPPPRLRFETSNTWYSSLDAIIRDPKWREFS